MGRFSLKKLEKYQFFKKTRSPYRNVFKRGFEFNWKLVLNYKLIIIKNIKIADMASIAQEIEEMKRARAASLQAELKNSF